MTTSYNSYINNIIGESLTTNPKKIWSIRQNSRENLGILALKINNNLKTTDHDKANALNDHFKSVFTNEQLPIPTKGSSPFPSIKTLEIGLNSIIKQLEAVNPNKAPGPDEIPAKILKETAKEISPSLEYNPCHGNTQKSNKCDPANYRPISLTCILCKVMEHIVLIHMWNHLGVNKIILPHQPGSVDSDLDFLVKAVHEWAASMNKRTKIDLILLDF